MPYHEQAASLQQREREEIGEMARIVATSCVADISCVLSQVQSLDPSEEVQMTWQICWTDLPTDRRRVIVYLSEGEAVEAFAVWHLLDTSRDRFERAEDMLLAALAGSGMSP